MEPGRDTEQVLLDAVIETIPVGVVVADAEAHVIRANTKALEILGRPSLEDPVFANWREVEIYDLDGDRLAPERFPAVRTLATGESVERERLEVVTRTGRVLVEVDTAPVRNAKGDTVGVIVVFEDVTTAERLRRAEHEFVTNAAHQLQSPLAGIVSAIEVLQAGAKDGPERDVFLGHIERESQRLAGLARALLVLARVQSGVESPREEIVALCPLLGEIAGSLRTADGVDIEISCPEELAVLTNRELVEQALLNVAENAAKYTTVGRIVFSGQRVEGAAAISVADTGPGISECDQQLILDRFYRGVLTGANGFGLGLAIARSAMDAVGGELSIESMVGSGTVVTLRVPRSASLVES
jgi:PAS domain S-box-containing protein